MCLPRCCQAVFPARSLGQWSKESEQQTAAGGSQGAATHGLEVLRVPCLRKDLQVADKADLYIHWDILTIPVVSETADMIEEVLVSLL